MNIFRPHKTLVVIFLFAAILLMVILSACSSKNDPIGPAEVSQETERLDGTSFQGTPAIRMTSGSKKLDMADQRKHQAMGYFSQGDLDKAEPLLIESLKLYEIAFGGEDVVIEELKKDIENQIIRQYMEVNRYLYMIYSETGRKR